MLQGFGQRLAEPGYIRGVNAYTAQDMARGMPSASLNGLTGYSASLRNVRPHLVPNQLTRNLVQFPVGLQSAMKPTWNPRAPPAGSNGGTEVPKMPYVRSFYPQGTFTPREHPEIVRASFPPFRRENGTLWVPNPQMQDIGNRSVQDPNQRHSPFLNRQRND